MKNNIMLTGEIKVGKSTIINKFIDKYFKDKNIAGFKTLPFYEEDEVKGYYIQDQLNKNEIADKSNIVGVVSEKEMRCFGITETFESLGVEILNKSFKEDVDLVLVDELGFFENNADNFKEIVHKVFDSKKQVIGVLKKKDTDFLNSIKERKDILVIEVTKENRDSILEKIVEYWSL